MKGKLIRASVEERERRAKKRLGQQKGRIGAKERPKKIKGRYVKS